MSHSTADDRVNLVDVQMNLVRPKEPVTGRLVATRPCTAGRASAGFVRHIEIDVSGTPLAGSIVAGQSFGVIPPGEDERGKPHSVRLFSMASPSWGEDGEGTIIATTVKRLIDEYHPQSERDQREDHGLFLGVCSNYLCDLSPGATVSLSGPAGKRFVLPTDARTRDYLFMATGTGIAPYRGMVSELLDHPNGPAHGQIHLIMGAPYRSDLLYHDQFTAWADRHENFHYHTAISRELTPDGRQGRYIPRLITDEMETLRPLLESPRTLVYMCGVMGMESGFFKMLHANGLGAPYISIDESLLCRPTEEWGAKEMKRGIKPTDRCMVEVY